jgi:hypothetical protein
VGKNARANMETPRTARTAALRRDSRESLSTGCLMILAVDSGDKHVGVASWCDGVATAYEVDADFWLYQFSKLVEQNVELVIIESFVLYPGKASAQSWSQMKTAEMIGAMKWIASQAGVPVVMQGANIKIPTRRQCKARGIDVGHRSNHAADASLHLHYYLLRQGLEVG